MNNIDFMDDQFDMIMDKYRDLAKEDNDIVQLVDHMYEHIDESPTTMSEENLQKFKDIIIRIVPGRAADIFFEKVNDMRQGKEQGQEWLQKLSKLEFNLVVTLLMYVMVLLYERDIPVEYKGQIKNGILTYSMFMKHDNNECCIL